MTPSLNAMRALACLDLTLLEERCSEADVDALIERAWTSHGPVAAICIWPGFVAHARAVLPEGIRIATVVNFPGGDQPLDRVVAEAGAALAAGADEIDMVVPYRRPGTAAIEAAVRAVRQEAGAAVVKAILETAALDTPQRLREVAEAAQSGGADFLKTSTGKGPGGASVSAVRELLAVVKRANQNVGVKVSGGVRTLADAERYLALVDHEMGAEWITPYRFRFGASGLLTALLAALEGHDPPAPGAGY
ncbi:MAG: deoxyribose-phosphate aldolase [Gammaproteobacteria bacterium]|nr:deoxyribose-phosphate aldolase [Gammaproteobacteria bacterium]